MSQFKPKPKIMRGVVVTRGACVRYVEKEKYRSRETYGRLFVFWKLMTIDLPTYLFTCSL